MQPILTRYAALHSKGRELRDETKTDNELMDTDTLRRG